MKIILLFFFICTNLIYSQTVKDSLKLDNRKNQIFAIINPDIYKDTLSKDDENDELLSDFIYYTRKLSHNVIYPVKIFTCKNIFFNKKLLKNPSNSVYYIVIRKGDKQVKVLEGVDTWESLKEEIDKIYSSKR